MVEKSSLNPRLAGQSSPGSNVDVFFSKILNLKLLLLIIA